MHYLVNKLRFRLGREPRMMIYCVAIAGVRQTSNFVMAMFLAALRGIDSEILKAAQIDGASAYASPIGESSSRSYGRPLCRALRSSAPTWRSSPMIWCCRSQGVPGGAGRAALDLHVFLHFHQKSDGGRLDERGDHALNHRRDHGASPLLRAAGSADERRGRSHSRALAELSRHSMIHRVVIYGVRPSSVRDRLPHAARRHGADIAEAARRGHGLGHVRLPA